MKRFLLFMGDCYYPSGGWNDFAAQADTWEEILKIRIERMSKYSMPWWHVYDAQEKAIIQKGRTDFEGNERITQ